MFDHHVCQIDLHWLYVDFYKVKSKNLFLTVRRKQSNNMILFECGIELLKCCIEFVLIACTLFKCVYSDFLTVTNLFASSYVQKVLSTSHLQTQDLATNICRVYLCPRIMFANPKECDFFTLQAVRGTKNKILCYLFATLWRTVNCYKMMQYKRRYSISPYIRDIVRNA